MAIVLSPPKTPSPPMVTPKKPWDRPTGKITSMDPIKKINRLLMNHRAQERYSFKNLSIKEVFAIP